MSWLLCNSQQIFTAFQFFLGVMNFLLTVQMLGVNPWSFTGVGCEIFRKYISNFQNSDLCWLSRGCSWGGHNLSLNCRRSNIISSFITGALSSFVFPQKFTLMIQAELSNNRIALL